MTVHHSLTTPRFQINMFQRMQPICFPINKCHFLFLRNGFKEKIGFEERAKIAVPSDSNRYTYFEQTLVFSFQYLLYFIIAAHEAKAQK